MGKTDIEWCDYTFNPWRGCSKISAGCAHCYAETLSNRFNGFHGVWGPNGTRVPASEAYWKKPLVWDKRAAHAGERYRVFCASLADVFEDREELDPHRERLWALIHNTPHLDWLLLTKRPARMAEWAATHGWPDNAWAGTSVEDQAAADKRIPHLLRVPARIRFLSMEPLLGPVDISMGLESFRGHDAMMRRDPAPVSWVIVGGESGSEARPMHPVWVEQIRNQCIRARVPFFFKQWGAWVPRGSWATGVPTPEGVVTMRLTIEGRNGQTESGEYHVWMQRLGKKKAGRVFVDRVWDEVPR